MLLVARPLRHATRPWRGRLYAWLATESHKIGWDDSVLANNLAHCHWPWYAVKQWSSSWSCWSTFHIHTMYMTTMIHSVRSSIRRPIRSFVYTSSRQWFERSDKEYQNDSWYTKKILSTVVINKSVTIVSILKIKFEVKFVENVVVYINAKCYVKHPIGLGGIGKNFKPYNFIFIYCLADWDNCWEVYTQRKN